MQGPEQSRVIAAVQCCVQVGCTCAARAALTGVAWQRARPVVHGRHAFRLFCHFALHFHRTCACHRTPRYLYASSQQAQAAQQAAQRGGQQERMASAQQFFSGGMFDQQARPGQGGQAMAGPGASRGGQQQQQDPWAGRGKPRKLSES